MYPIGQFSDMMVVAVCHSATDDVVHVSIEKGTCTCNHCQDSITTRWSVFMDHLPSLDGKVDEA